SVGDTAATLPRLLSPVSGLATWAQARPFQCKIRFWLASLPLPEFPTAHASLRDRALTPDSESHCRDGFGLATRAHLVPFQCSTRVLKMGPGPLLMRSPTAQRLAGETASTPYRSSARGGGPGLGLATRRHVAPFQCSTRVSKVVAVSRSPTAQALAADSALTAHSVPG